jgi:periplasmic protein TonB
MFMKIFFSFALLITVLCCKAQDTSAIKKTIADSSKTFSKVEFESDYPGGANGWARFLKANLQYPNKAVRKKIEGTVIVQFIIDKDGSVSDVQAISGPESGGLMEEAVRVIKISGNWKPAVQNGKKVKSYKKQPIQFKLAYEK